MSDVARSAAGAVRRTVLTVVADPVIRELLALHLREAGFFPVTAATSAEACRLAGEVLPDVLLIDPDAPECADLAFCARLSETVRIVVLSGSPACCSRVPRVALCLHKPYAPRDLVERLQGLPDRDDSPDLSRQGGIEIDLDRHLITVRRQGRRVEPLWPFPLPLI